MFKIIFSVYVLAVLLYFLYTYIRKEKPYKPLFIGISFITLSIALLTTITYLF